MAESLFTELGVGGKITIILLIICVVIQIIYRIIHGNYISLLNYLIGFLILIMLILYFISRNKKKSS